MSRNHANLLFIILTCSVLSITTQGYAQNVQERQFDNIGIYDAPIYAKYLQHHDPDSTLLLNFTLKLNHRAQFDQFLKNLEDPKSPQFHHFLTYEQFKHLYGPTQDEIDAVKSYANSHDLRVSWVSSDKILVHITGKSGAIEQALGVTLNDYSIGKRTFYQATTAPIISTEIAPFVSHISGLENERSVKSVNVINDNCPNNTGGGYTPQQIASYYDWPSITTTSTGHGQAIGIIAYNSSDVKMSDFSQYFQDYGLPAHNEANGNQIQQIYIDGQSTDPTYCFEAEATTDVELAAAMAPGAGIYIYDVKTDNPDYVNALEDAYDRVMIDDQVTVVSTSIGIPEGHAALGNYANTLDDTIFPALEAEGITLVAASGDSADTGNPYPGDSDVPIPGGGSRATSDVYYGELYPASSPYVTAVGGSSLINGVETAWSSFQNNSLNKLKTSYYWGTGGGTSIYFSIPWWQSSAGISGSYRSTSDISMNADISYGYQVVINGSYQKIGGTSTAVPQIAALIADAVQENGGNRLGLLNPILYQIAKSDNYSSDFHDITSGNTFVSNYYVDFNCFCGYEYTGTYDATRTGWRAGIGWDHPTGWGSPIAKNLITDIDTYSKNNQTALLIIIDSILLQ